VDGVDPGLPGQHLGDLLDPVPVRGQLEDADRPAGRVFVGWVSRPVRVRDCWVGSGDPTYSSVGSGDPTYGKLCRDGGGQLLVVLDPGIHKHDLPQRRHGLGRHGHIRGGGSNADEVTCRFSRPLTLPSPQWGEGTCGCAVPRQAQVSVDRFRPAGQQQTAFQRLHVQPAEIAPVPGPAGGTLLAAPAGAFRGRVSVARYTGQRGNLRIHGEFLR